MPCGAAHPAREISFRRDRARDSLSLSLLPPEKEGEKSGIEGKRYDRSREGRVTLYVSVEDRTPSLPFQTPLSLVRFASNCNIFTPGAQSTLMQSCLWNIVSRLLKVAEMEMGGCRCLFGVVGRRKSQGAGIVERVVRAGCFARMALLGA